MVRGRKPKPDDQKVTRHELTVGWIEVPDMPFKPGKDHALGKHPLGEDWNPETVAWWADVSTMPHCVLWAKTQWRFARATALMFDRWLKGDNARGVELRRREALLGTTFDALRDLRIRYVNPKAGRIAVEEEPEQEAVAPVSDFAAAQRRRLMDAP